MVEHSGEHQTAPGGHIGPNTHHSGTGIPFRCRTLEPRRPQGHPNTGIGEAAQQGRYGALLIGEVRRMAHQRFHLLDAERRSAVVLPVAVADAYTGNALCARGPAGVGRCELGHQCRPTIARQQKISGTERGIRRQQKRTMQRQCAPAHQRHSPSQCTPRPPCHRLIVSSSGLRR